MTESAPEHEDRDRANASLVNQEQRRSSSEGEVVGIDAKVLLGDTAKIESSTPGGFLRQERERQERPLQHIADEMHLSRQAIEAIEGNRFGEFGAPVFAKGHLRRYAIVLRVSVEEVFQRYDQLGESARAHESAPPVARSQDTTRRVELTREASGLRIAPRTSGGSRWLLVPVVILLAACAAGTWWWWSERTPAPTAATQPMTVTPPIADEPEVETTIAAMPAETQVSTPAQPPSPTSSPTTVEQPPVAAPAPVIAQRPPASTSPSPGKVRVRLIFKQDSWAEVYDGRGNRMMYDVGRSDLPRVIDADPPVQVVLGYAPAVNVEINGAAITVPERRVNNSVARFHVQADGRIQ
jgi:cytoskeleton protein RodZ